MVRRFVERLPLLIRVARGCGPVVGLELRIISRQRRTYALRMGYVVALAIVAGIVWMSASGSLSGISPMHLAAALPLAAGEVVRSVLMFLFFGGQIGAVIMMTGAFSTDLQGGGLSALRSTPLSFGQIVLGRFLGRMAQLTVILLAAVPALALIRGFGGVPWGLVLGGMVVVLGAAGCAGAVALHNAARLRTGWTAMRASLSSVFFFCIPGLWWLRFRRDVLQSGDWWIPAVVYAGVLPLLLARAVGALRYHARHKQDRDPDLPPRLARDPYVYLPKVPDEPGGVLEPVRTTYADLVNDDFSRARPINGSPIVWRALRPPRLQWSKKAVVLLVLLCIGLPVAWSLGGAQAVYGCSYVLVVVGLFIACVASALLSASAISSERESGCLALLLTTPLTDRQILQGKVQAIIVRILVAIFIVAGCLTSLTMLGRMHIGGVIPVLLLCGGALAFVIGLGLYVSSRCRKSATAMAVTMGSLACLWVLMPWLAGSLFQEGQGVSPAQWAWWIGARWLRPLEAVWRLTRLAVRDAPLGDGVYVAVDGPMLRTALATITMAAIYASAGMLLAWRAMRQIRRDPG